MACDQGDRRSVGRLLVCCGAPDGTDLYVWVDCLEYQNMEFAGQQKGRIIFRTLNESFATCYFFLLCLDNAGIRP
jgi:hypothetical protein